MAWLHNLRWIVTRREYKIQNYLGCIRIIPQQSALPGCSLGQVHSSFTREVDLMSTTLSQPTVFFPRKTSGLVRVMSPAAAWAYNVLTMGLIFPWVFFWGPASFPNGSLALGILLALAFQFPISYAYCYLGSSFPRSGGDYVFQSRVLGGFWGFVSVMSGFVIWILLWVALSGWLMAVLGLAPLCLGLGYLSGSAALASLGLWFQSPVGVVTVSIAQVAVVTLFLNQGFRKYVVFQWFLLGATLLSFVLLLWQFGWADPNDFRAGINSFTQWLLNARGDTNPAVQGDFYAAAVNGWTQLGGGQMGWGLSTLAIAPIAWTSLQWATYSVEQGSEISQADSFNKQRSMLVGSAVTVGLGLCVLAVWEERAIGSQFMRAISAAYQTGSGDPDVVAAVGALKPMPNVLAIAITKSPLVLLLICIGYMANAFQITCNCFIGVSRILVGMSLDRVIPVALSHVDTKKATPTVAHWTYFVLSIPVIVAYSFVPAWASLTLGVTFACGYVFVLSSLAAGLVALRRHGFHLSGLGLRERRIAAVTGIGGFLLGMGMLLALLLNPAYGINSPLGLGVVAGVIVFSMLWYACAFYYNKRKGLDLRALYSQMPPE